MNTGFTCDGWQKKEPFLQKWLIIIITIKFFDAIILYKKKTTSYSCVTYSYSSSLKETTYTPGDRCRAVDQDWGLIHCGSCDVALMLILRVCMCQCLKVNWFCAPMNHSLSTYNHRPVSQACECASVLMNCLNVQLSISLINSTIAVIGERSREKVSFVFLSAFLVGFSFNYPFHWPFSLLNSTQPLVYFFSHPFSIFSCLTRSSTLPVWESPFKGWKYGSEAMKWFQK